MPFFQGRVGGEERIWTGPPRARTEDIYVDLGYWTISRGDLGQSLTLTLSPKCEVCPNPEILTHNF